MVMMRMTIFTETFNDSEGFLCFYKMPCGHHSYLFTYILGTVFQAAFQEIHSNLQNVVVHCVNGVSLTGNEVADRLSGRGNEEADRQRE